MKTNTLGVAVLILLGSASLLLPTAASAQDVKLEGVSFQEVLDRLFGVEPDPGLLDGDTRFQFHAEGVVLTSDEVSAFFASSDESTSDFAHLIVAAEQIRGTELKIQGLIDDTPFNFKLSGKQIKLDGITLTQAELEALVEELQGISGLHEAKIQAFVDGEEVVVKIQNVPGRVKVENGELSPDAQRQDAREKRGANGRNAQARMQRFEKLDRSERPEHPERPERPERLEKVERFERPERGGRR